VCAASSFTALGFLTIGVFLLTRAPSPRHKELREMRMSANKICAELRKKLPDKDDYQNITQVFGKQSGQSLQKICADREKLIRQVMGQIEDYDKFLLFGERDH
jgi:hypothetical protein